MNIAIIGCSRGIGHFLANSLETDHDVFRISQTITGKRSFRADAASVSDLEACAIAVQKEMGHIDALVYSAGVQGPIGPALSLNPYEWSRVIDVNLKGFFNSVYSFSRLLNQSPRGKIIAFSGGGATGARPRFSAYAAAKCGLVRLVETLAEELPEYDINAIAPGSIFTRMTREVLAAGADAAGEKEFAAARATIEDPQALENVLKLVTFLLSSESSGITGRLISAKWDTWTHLESYGSKDTYRLRRINPACEAR